MMGLAEVRWRIMTEVLLDNQRKKQLSSDLWKLSYPSIIAYTLQAFYDIIDMVWVGRISKEAIGGVTLFSTIYMLFTVLNDVAGSSSVSMLSQSYGRNTPKRTQRIAEQTITFKVILAIITAVLLLIFLQPLLNIYSDDPVVKQAALDYGRIRIFALPIAFSSYSVNTIFRCTGDSKTPMKIMLSATAINMILDPVLMFESLKIGSWTIKGFGLGVYGAGLATVIATTISFVIGFYILIRGQRDVTISFKGLLRLDKEIDKQLLSIGLPAGFQLFVRQGFNALLMLLITSYGTIAVTVYGLGNKLIGFSFTPIAGFTFAGSTLIGHALGRERVDEASYLAKVSTGIITSIIAVFAFFMAIFPRVFLGLFNKDADVLYHGTPMLRWVALGMIVAALASGMRVVFSGSGLNRPILIATVISRWLVQLPLMYYLVKFQAVELSKIWITFLIAELADLAVVAYYYRKGKWKYNRV